MTPQPSKDMNDKLKDQLILLDRAMVSTDDNYPIQYHLPLEDLVAFIQKYVSQTLNDCLPVKKEKRSQNFGDPEWNYKHGFNSAIDQTRSNLNNKLESK